MNNHPGGIRAGNGAALDQGGERGGSFSSFQVLGRLSESSHGIGCLADYRFYYPIGHVRGNFDLKTMAARVGSSPPVTAPKQRQGVACEARVG